MESMTSRIAGKLQQEIQKRTKRTDAKYFVSAKRGEVHELKEDLNSNDKERQKSAVKKIIANMTLGKDVSQLFTDVVKLSRTVNMEIKKLVYLYIMANAKLHPDKAIMAVNTFVLDSQHPIPAVRALAIRTMLCVRVENMTDHCCVPLRNALKDEDIYVRKTATIGILKLFHTNPKMCEDQGFLTDLQTLLVDRAPAVIGNAVLALGEIMDNSNFSFALTSGTVMKLLHVLSSCTEVGQVSVLDFVSRYRAKPAEAEGIIERVAPRLQHSSPSVVLSAVRCILRNIDLLPEEKKRSYYPKFAPPLVTLMSSNPQTQYVTLRNIEIIIQKYPKLFGPKDVKVFFCKYTDPTYVKLEKLEVLLRLLTDKNAENIVSELHEYCYDVEPTFSRRSIEALGSCAIRLERITPKVAVLLLKLASENTQLVEAVLAATKDVLRKYPLLATDLLPPLLADLEIEALDDGDAKTSLVWTLGEFGAELPDAKDKLTYFVETFRQQQSSVQLAVLTATVKIFLRSSKENEALLNDVLQKATTEDNPDLRDRAYIYWRMLSNDKHATKMNDFVIGKKPTIKADGIEDLDLSRLNDMLSSLNTMASVYHKPASSFVPKYGYNPNDVDEEEEDDYDDEESPIALAPKNDSPKQVPAQQQAHSPITPAPEVVPEQSRKNELDFLFSDNPSTSSAPQQSQQLRQPPSNSSNGLGLDDIFGTPAPASAPASPSPYPQLLLPAHSDGLQLNGAFIRENNRLHMALVFTNHGTQPLTNFAVQFNSNMLGLKEDGQLNVPTVNPGQTVHYKHPVSSIEDRVNTQNFPTQIAIKNNLGKPYYFSMEPALDLSVLPNSGYDKQNFIPNWRRIQGEVKHTVRCSVPDLRAAMERNNIKYIAATSQTQYFSCATLTRVNLLIEFQQPANGEVAVSAKADD
ncbi:Beta-adaptin-like protein C, partial [Diplonema papillatum]